MAQGYFTDTTEIILVVNPQKIEAGELFGRRHGFKVCTGARYLGVYIGDDISKGDWLKDYIDKWERYICAPRKTADKYPQESYAAVDHVVQSEWIFPCNM